MHKTQKVFKCIWTTNQSKHLDQHIGQNNVNGHGSFNLKQSSIVHSFWNFFEFHNQFALLTMFTLTKWKSETRANWSIITFVIIIKFVIRPYNFHRQYYNHHHHHHHYHHDDYFTFTITSPSSFSDGDYHQDRIITSMWPVRYGLGYHNLSGENNWLTMSMSRDRINDGLLSCMSQTLTVLSAEDVTKHPGTWLLRANPRYIDSQNDPSILQGCR